MDLEVVESKLVKLMTHLKSLVMLVLWKSSADIPMICKMTLMKNFELFWLTFQYKNFDLLHRQNVSKLKNINLAMGPIRGLFESL